jgi:hypothetical protein
VRNEVLQRAGEESDILQTIKRMKTNWSGHILQWNCLLKQVTEGKIGGKDSSEGQMRIKTEAATG